MIMTKTTIGLFKTRSAAVKESKNRRKQEMKDRKSGRPGRFYSTYRVEKSRGASWKVVKTNRRYKNK